MWVRKECFADEEICQCLSSDEGKEGRCEASELEGEIYDISKLTDFFSSVIKLFIKDSNSSNTIVSLLIKDSNIFSDNSVGDKIIKYFLDEIGSDLDVKDKVSYNKEILERMSAWDKLKVDVKEKYRYFVDHEQFDECADLSPECTLKAGEELYRSRIIPYGESKLTPDNMGCPPKEKAIAGRANPLGIPYLYLCKEEKTTYFEIRAGFMDRISVGKFKIERDLSIVDFNSQISLFVSSDGIEDLSDTIVKKKILDSISYDLSKPMRRYDTEIEYVPTQLICEYCKRNGADGICYSSSLHKGGVNYVLFNPNDAKCIEVVEREIKKIDIDIK